jgi:hypothetical protein
LRAGFALNRRAPAFIKPSPIIELRGGKVNGRAIGTGVFDVVLTTAKEPRTRATSDGRNEELQTEGAVRSSN